MRWKRKSHKGRGIGKNGGVCVRENCVFGGKTKPNGKLEGMKKHKFAFPVCGCEI